MAEFDPIELVSGDTTYRCVDLVACAKGALDGMPWVHRILLENIVRRGDPVMLQSADAVIGARGRSSASEIAFYPTRLLMHDTTFTPAFVDIAGMRQWLAEHGVDPSSLNPILQVDT